MAAHQGRVKEQLEALRKPLEWLGMATITHT